MIKIVTLMKECSIQTRFSRVDSGVDDICDSNLKQNVETMS